MLNVAILVASTIEWKALKSRLNRYDTINTPYGELFEWSHADCENCNIIVALIGWGKISAAGGTQHIISVYKPDILLAIGTAGGIVDKCSVGDVVLATHTSIYDMHVEIGNLQEEIAFYDTTMDYSIAIPSDSPKILRGGILTADSDLRPSMINWLVENFDGVACDWEAGSIAFVAKANRIPCLIVKYISDVVTPEGCDIYGQNVEQFTDRVVVAMEELITRVPLFINSMMEL